MIKYPLFFILLFVNNYCFSQNKYVDSLKIALKNATQDTTRLNLRYEIGEESSIFRRGYWDSLCSDAKKSNNKTVEGNAITNLGFILYNQGDISEALDCFTKGLNIHKEIGDKSGIAASFNNLGVVYEYQGNIPLALDYYAKDLELEKELNNKAGIALSLNNIALIYLNQGDYENSLNYNQQSLAISTQLKDQLGIAQSLSNIGLGYISKHDSAQGLNYYLKSLAIYESIDDQKGVAQALSNLGSIYLGKNELAKALDFYFKSLKIDRNRKYKKGIATLQNNISGVYMKFASAASQNYKKQNYYKLAECYADSSLKLAKELGFPKSICNAEERLSDIYSKKGEFGPALEHYKQFVIFNDSINNERTRKASIKNQLSAEFDKKEAILKEQQDKERTVAEQKSFIQQVIILSAATVLFLVVLFMLYVMRTLKTTRLQKIIIEEKQREILDSIRYAKRIQQSLLPTETYIDRIFNRLKR